MIIASRSREERKADQRPLNKKLRDLRLYCTPTLPTKALYPYDYQYAEIFLNLLSWEGLLCPVYDHIYIGVGPSMYECSGYFYSIESRIEYGLAVIDYDNYFEQSLKKKDQTVFEIFATGLRDIAEVDGLNTDIIAKVIEKIKEKGLDTELIYKAIENNSHQLTVSYFAKSLEVKNPVYFSLLEKGSGKVTKKSIGTCNNFQLYLWLQKVTLTKTHIKVKSGNSIAADVSLKNLPRNMDFDIKEFINE